MHTFYTKTTVNYITIINLKKQKNTFLCILNNLNVTLRMLSILSLQNNFKNQIICRIPISLPFHSKSNYFKKVINKLNSC